MDNNSTDDTADVIARHVAARKLPIRPLFEPKQGHSNARNCAVDAARGELLIWADDDVLVDEHWLTEYLSAAETWAGAAYFGGPVRPWFEVPPPPWVSRHLDLLGGPFALLDHGGQTRPLAVAEGVVGANMAYRKRVFEKVRFNPHLGRQGSQLIGCDETAVFRRLKSDGETGVWIGSAGVEHFVPAKRMTTRYVWDWFEAAGRSEVRLDPPARGSTLLGVPRWAVRQYLVARLRAAARRPWRDRTWMLCYQEGARLLGMIREMSA